MQLKVLINLTPHDIHLYHPGGVSVFPTSGQPRSSDHVRSANVVRCSKTHDVAARYLCRDDEGSTLPIELIRIKYINPQGLPDPRPNTLYIVSSVTCEARPDRRDLIAPAGLVRSNSGAVIGCRRFKVSWS